MIKYIIPLLTLITFLGCEESTDNTSCENNCSDYSSQNAAQAAFNSNPECHKNLDRDNDGIACE